MKILAIASAMGATAFWATMPTAHAVSLVTTNVADVVGFQAGASVLGFDDLPPNGGGGSSGNTGIAIQPASQLAEQFLGLGVRFFSDGGPAGIVGVQGLPNQADAKSPFNLIGGSRTAGVLPVLDYFRPISLAFVLADGSTPSTTDRVGAWNDPTGSRVRLSVFDAAGTLLESVEANQGYFVGISRPGIASARFTYVSTQSVPGFALDDVSFGAVSGVPMPPTSWLLAAGLLALGVRSRGTVWSKRWTA